jgi:hypothetical protein
LKINIVCYSSFSTAAAIRYSPSEENFKSIILDFLFLFFDSLGFAENFFGNSSQSYLKKMLPISLPKARRVLPSC